MYDIIKEFVVESNENLDQLDHDLVELEKDRSGSELLSGILRAFHTIKRVSGFLNLHPAVAQDSAYANASVRRRGAHRLKGEELRLWQGQ